MRELRLALAVAGLFLSVSLSFAPNGTGPGPLPSALEAYASKRRQTVWKPCVRLWLLTHTWIRGQVSPKVRTQTALLPVSRFEILVAGTGCKISSFLRPMKCAFSWAPEHFSRNVWTAPAQVGVPASTNRWEKSTPVAIKQTCLIDRSTSTRSSPSSHTPSDKYCQAVGSSLKS